jgi:hypothetical protein
MGDDTVAWELEALLLMAAAGGSVSVSAGTTPAPVATSSGGQQHAAARPQPQVKRPRRPSVRSRGGALKLIMLGAPVRPVAAFPSRFSSVCSACVTDGLLAWQGVGKSCLVSQCLGQPCSERHTPTIGVEHHKHTLNVNADAVVVQLWDRGANHCLS